MTALDRLTPPAFRSVEDIQLIDPSEFTLSNGLVVHYIHSKEAELLRIELIFPAGEKVQKHPLIAKAANSLIKNGTAKLTAAVIAQKVDQYGAFLETNMTKDLASVVVFTLNKYLDPVLDIVLEAIQEASYPEKEIHTYIENSKQAHVVNLEKVGFIARREFNRKIFVDQPSYSWVPEFADFDRVTQKKLQRFYEHHYGLSNVNIRLAGRIDDEVRKQLDKHFGFISTGYKNQPSSKQEDKIMRTEGDAVFIQKEGAIQSAIRIGKRMFNRNHSDYHKMNILNMVLGGYFGSRLMANIREDKGYTYGIGSAVVSFHQSGLFFISTEVGANVTDLALKEIYHEIEKLREELIGKEELELVKNYMLGVFLRDMDGAFSQMDRFNEIHPYGLSNSYYRDFIRAVKSVTPAQLRDMAVLHLAPSSLIEVVVGSK